MDMIIGYDASKMNPGYPQGPPSGYPGMPPPAGYQGMPPPGGPQYGKNVTHNLNMSLRCVHISFMLVLWPDNDS